MVSTARAVFAGVLPLVRVRLVTGVMVRGRGGVGVLAARVLCRLSALSAAGM